MTKISNNPLLKGASGMLGDVVVFRKLRGDVVMANKPKKSEKPLSEKQLEVRRQFKNAANYAKGQLADPVSKAEYEQAGLNKEFSAYLMAVTDYLKPPTVDFADLKNYRGEPGNTIKIEANDDFRVTEVFVTITSPSGIVIESGAAVQSLGGEWVYTVTQANTAPKGTLFAIEAKDKPGNVGMGSFTF